jgi:hypothetical protein
VKFSLTILLLFIILNPGRSYGTKRDWSEGSARTISKGRFETGLFSPLKYGLLNDLEISANPLLFFVIPHIALKKGWLKYSDITIATRHSITYPTPLLRLISKEGTGGILPDDSQIPHLLSMGTEFLGTWDYKKNHFFTFLVGLDLATSLNDYNVPTIDLPLIYQRSAHWHTGYSFHFGMDFEGKLVGNFHYLVDFDVFLFPGHITNKGFEHKAMVVWKKSKRFSIMAGYKLVIGEYPYGADKILLPLIDFAWAW